MLRKFVLPVVDRLHSWLDPAPDSSGLSPIQPEVAAPDPVVLPPPQSPMTPCPPLSCAPSKRPLTGGGSARPPPKKRRKHRTGSAGDYVRETSYEEDRKEAEIAQQILEEHFAEWSALPRSKWNPQFCEQLRAGGALHYSPSTADRRMMDFEKSGEVHATHQGRPFQNGEKGVFNFERVFGGVTEAEGQQSLRQAGELLRDLDDMKGSAISIDSTAPRPRDTARLLAAAGFQPSTTQARAPGRWGTITDRAELEAGFDSVQRQVDEFAKAHPESCDEGKVKPEYDCFMDEVGQNLGDECSQQKGRAGRKKDTTYQKSGRKPAKGHKGPELNRFGASQCPIHNGTGDLIAMCMKYGGRRLDEAAEGHVREVFNGLYERRPNDPKLVLLAGLGAEGKATLNGSDFVRLFDEIFWAHRREMSELPPADRPELPWRTCRMDQLAAHQTTEVREAMARAHFWPIFGPSGASEAFNVHDYKPNRKLRGEHHRLLRNGRYNCLRSRHVILGEFLRNTLVGFNKEVVQKMYQTMGLDDGTFFEFLLKEFEADFVSHPERIPMPVAADEDDPEALSQNVVNYKGVPRHLGQLGIKVRDEGEAAALLERLGQLTPDASGVSVIHEYRARRRAAVMTQAQEDQKRIKALASQITDPALVAVEEEDVAPTASLTGTMKAKEEQNKKDKIAEKAYAAYKARWIDVQDDGRLVFKEGAVQAVYLECDDSGHKPSPACKLTRNKIVKIRTREKWCKCSVPGCARYRCHLCTSRVEREEVTSLNVAHYFCTDHTIEHEAFLVDQRRMGIGSDSEAE